MEPYTEDPYEPEMKEISKGDDTMLSFFSSYKLDHYDNSCFIYSLYYRLTFSHFFWSKKFLINYAKQT